MSDRIVREETALCMRARRRAGRRLLAVMSAVALCAAGGTGCQSTKPTPEQIRQVNELVSTRTGTRWDAGALLAIDPRVPPPAPTGVLTLDEAVDRTLLHNLNLVASADNLEIAHAQLVQAGLLANPQIGQSSGVLFPISPAGPHAAWDINISYQFQTLIALPARKAIAKAQQYQAGIDLAMQAFDLSQQAQSKYQEMTHLIRSRQLAERVAGLYDRAVKVAEVRQKVGIIPQPEVNRARLQYLDATRQVQHLQTQYARAAQEMNWLMGISAAPQWHLAAEQASPPATLLPPAQSDLEMLGVKYRMDLRRADFDRRLGQYGIDLAKRNMFPAIQLGADYARDASRNASFGPTLLSLTLPIFDPGIVALRLSEAQARKADKAYVALEGQVKQDVRAALANWRIAEEDVRFFRERQIPQGEENVRLMETSFRLGNDDLDSLLNVYRDYVTALQSYEDATSAYEDTTVALHRAVGAVWERVVVPPPFPATQPTTAPAATAPGSARPAATQPAATQPATTEPEQP